MDLNSLKGCFGPVTSANVHSRLYIGASNSNESTAVPTHQSLHRYEIAELVEEGLWQCNVCSGIIKVAYRCLQCPDHGECYQCFHGSDPAGVGSPSRESSHERFHKFDIIENRGWQCEKCGGLVKTSFRVRGTTSMDQQCRDSSCGTENPAAPSDAFHCYEVVENGVWQCDGCKRLMKMAYRCEQSPEKEECANCFWNGNNVNLPGQNRASQSGCSSPTSPVRDDKPSHTRKPSGAMRHLKTAVRVVKVANLANNAWDVASAFL
ncbi:hypothetical protein DL93DRAFT_2153666 [Clavulina sp. PMI_390]|nr:hypothetical protein DL93DRAFT_2153666 [Clavulina sp. PMI_390]